MKAKLEPVLTAKVTLIKKADEKNETKTKQDKTD